MFDSHVETIKFLSTPSARRATYKNNRCICAVAFLSTPSARRATGCCGELSVDVNISIHALREEGDGAGLRKSSDTPYFYPRPPRGGRPP